MYICVQIFGLVTKNCISLHWTNNIKKFKVFRASLNEQARGPNPNQMCSWYSFSLQSWFLKWTPVSLQVSAISTRRKKTPLFIFAYNRPVPLLPARMQGYARRIIHARKTRNTEVEILKPASFFFFFFGDNRSHLNSWKRETICGSYILWRNCGCLDNKTWLYLIALFQASHITE